MGWSTFFRHLKALNKKNLIIFKRNKRAVICEILIPVLLIGIISLTAVQLPKAEDKPREYLYENSGKYLGPRGEMSYFDLRLLGNSTDTDTRVAIVGKNETYGKDLLVSIMQDNNVMYDARFDSLSDVRSYISKSDNHRKSGISYVLKLDVDDEKKDFELTTLKSDFDNTFNPFNLDQRTPNTYYYDKYVGISRNDFDYNYIGNVAQLIAEKVGEEKTGTPLKIHAGYAQKSSQPYKDTILPDVMDQMYPIFIVIIYTLPYMYFLQRAVEEKQTKTRESMRMMGMVDSAYWASWFILFCCQVLLTSIILTVGSIFTLFPGCNPFIIFIFYFFYGMSLFGMVLILIAIFDSIRTASIGGLVINLGTYYLRYAFQNSTPMIWRIVGGIIPSLNMYNANHVLWIVQSYKKVSFDNMGYISQNYSLNIFIVMCIFDFFVWVLLGLYITYIVPTEFGTRRHPCFCLMFKCRRGNRNRNSFGGHRENQSLLNGDEPELTGIEDKEAEGQYERVGNDLRDLEEQQQCLKIRNLMKVYPNGFKAVDGLNLNMYSGQIFALLGHNGAGKTTTISVLTGLFEATSGQAHAFGIDLLNDQDEARKIMGVCPQHNVLFPTLTPTEHFDIFCDFKGVPNSERQASIQKCLENVDLIEQRDMQSKNLSGGQKRKVSVGIAMLGDSKIVLLDEPTSGMDPTARRRLWELLKQNKEDKIIILTTHYMEEADILGDRIAIMVHGDAQCCGSSLFLKRKFGVGYNITIDKTTQQDAPQIDRFITDRIPGAIKLSEVSSEISYQLPNAAIGRFKNFFIELDERKEDLEIKSYGIGVTTLEEVFIKVGDGIVKAEKYDNTSINASPDQKANEDYCLVDESVKGLNLTMLQLYAMIVMRIKITARECRVLFLEIFYPTLLIVIMAIILAVSTSGFNNVHTLNQSVIPKHQTVFYSYNSGNITDASVATSFMSRYYNENKFTMESLGDVAETQDLNGAIYQFDEKLFENYITDKSYLGVYLRNKKIETAPASTFYDVITMVEPTQSEITGYAIQGTVTSILRDFTDDDEITFTIKRGPFPKSKLDDDILKIVLTLLTVFSFSTALGIMTASLAGSICKERDDSLKHQQIVSGGSMLSYWVSNYCMDLLKFTIPGLSFIIIMLSFSVDIKLYWLFDILCILAILPFTYLITFIFTKENIARNVCRYIHIFAGGILAPIVFGLLMGNKGTKIAGNILKWGFKWNPSFCFAWGLTQITLGETINKNTDEDSDEFAIDKAGADILALILQIIIYFGIITLIENKCFINRRGHAVRQGGYEEVKGDLENPYNLGADILDADVQDEERRVANTPPNQLEVRTYMLNKFYKDRSITKHAVKDVSFGIKFGECFALLGINGAGKTTTFKALTGDVTPSSGEVHIGGFDVQNRIEYSSVRKLIGYCPQFDALFTNLTVKEHLEFYSRIKGVIPSMRSIVVERQLVEMGLEEYTNTHANRLSGGNKRKLSVAMAMIGNPPIVFLDEPSTGMDPKAKRFMWDIIARISTLRKKSAVILTTHSMEEAEALSTKLGIMAEGQFKCFGTAQHIKTKFGDGYEIEVRIKLPTEEEMHEMIAQTRLSQDTLVNDRNANEILQHFESGELMEEIRIGGLGDHVHKEFLKGGMKIKNFIEFIRIEKNGLKLVQHLANDFGSVVLMEHYGNSFRIKLPNFDESIGVMFGKFEDRYRGEFSVEEYSINQTSLEQIFNNFAKQSYTLSQTSRTFRRQE